MAGPASSTLTPDTNVYVRAIVGDDPERCARAVRLLAEATRIVVPTIVWCEIAWVLRQSYRYPSADLRAAVDALPAAPTIDTDRDAVASGLAHLDAGGDFADGVIAHHGANAGGVFVSFDGGAVAIERAAGRDVRDA